MPKDTKTLGNNKARACESLGFAHKKGCANILTQPHFCCNNSISNIESVKKEFIINLDTVYNKPLRYLLKT